MAFPLNPSDNQTFTTPAGLTYTFLDGAWTIDAADSTGPWNKELFEYSNAAAFPQVGRIETFYVDRETNKVYRWTGSEYKTFNGNISISSSAPTNPSMGDFWFDPVNAILYIRVHDSTSNIWLDISTAAGIGSSSDPVLTTVIPATTYLVVDQSCSGKVLECSPGASISLPAGLPLGFNLRILLPISGDVMLTPASGVSLNGVTSPIIKSPPVVLWEVIPTHIQNSYRLAEI